MAQRYNIYINEQVLCIAEYVPEDLGKHQQIDSHRVDVQLIFSLLKNQNDNVCYLVLTRDAKAWYKQLAGWLKIIEAAGGLVQNEKGEYLLIFRRGKWDLPKGKIDDGEKKKNAAIREVEEECGIKVKKLGDKIGKTYHIYMYKNDLVLKKTHWYNMTSASKKLVPQLDEDITEAIWLAPENFAQVLTNTYPLIREILESAVSEKR
ncbi:MAG: NUDIX domain-containing protein [Mucilaginibacter polytrichastri]|nr:NUDIX domain-containing protein [Mucilaginibacter polytrichastri]